MAQAQEIKEDVTQRVRKWGDVVDAFKTTQFCVFGGEGCRISGEAIIGTHSFTVLYWGSFSNVGLMTTNRPRFTALKPEMSDFSIAKVYVSHDGDDTQALQKAFSSKADYFTMPGAQSPVALTSLFDGPPVILIINDAAKVAYHGCYLPVISSRDWAHMENQETHVTKEENKRMKAAEDEEEEPRGCCGGCCICCAIA